MVNNSSLIVSSPNMCFFEDTMIQYPSYVFGVGVLITVLNIIFAPVAVLGNSVIIIALLKTRDLQIPSNFLIGNLAVADLITGLLCQPLHVVFKIAEFYKLYDTLCVGLISASVCGWAASSVSCCTLCFIAIERYLALHFHLRYFQILSIKKLIIPVVTCWIFFTALSISRFFTKNVFFFTVISMTALVIIFTIIFLAYGRIYQIVRRHRRQIKSHGQQSFSDQTPTELVDRVPGRTPTELVDRVPGRTPIQRVDRFQLARYRKSTNTMFIILGFFLLAYVPLFFAQITLQMVGYVYITKILHDFSVTLVFTNASVNPIIYCLRMEHLRRACVRLVPFPRKWSTRSRKIHVKEKL